MFDWFKRLFRPGGDDRRLLRLAQGDPARVERLIAFELKRDPSLTRAQAIRSAADRLEYERSR